MSWPTGGIAIILSSLDLIRHSEPHLPFVTYNDQPRSGLIGLIGPEGPVRVFQGLIRCTTICWWMWAQSRASEQLTKWGIESLQTRITSHMPKWTWPSQSPVVHLAVWLPQLPSLYCNVSIIGSHHVTCDKVPGKIIVSSEVPSGCDMWHQG